MESAVSLTERRSSLWFCFQRLNNCSPEPIFRQCCLVSHSEHARTMYFTRNKLMVSNIELVKTDKYRTEMALHFVLLLSGQRRVTAA